MNIGIIYQKNSPSYWETEFVRTLQKSFLVEFIEIKSPNKQLRSGFFWNLYEKIDNKVFSLGEYALRASTNEEVINSIKVSQIAEFSTFDLIINLSSTYNDETLFQYSKGGILFLDYLLIPNKYPPAAVEYLKGNDTVQLNLYHSNTSYEHANLVDLFRVSRDSISFKRTINQYYWQAFAMLTRNVSHYLKHNKTWGKSKVSGNLETKGEFFSDYKIPLFLLRLVAAKMVSSLRNTLYFNQWILLLKIDATDENFQEFSSYKEILPPKDRFWADPFLVLKDDRCFLFIEELVYREKLGKLAVIPMNKDFTLQNPITILQKDYHLSYPFIFEDNGTMYMIPETSGNRDIQLYRCTSFPDKWEFERTLMTDIVAVDTTIHKKDNIYLMFTNVQVHPSCSKHNNLNIYWSTELNSNNWQPLGNNPVVSDITSARPAGNVFRIKDKLIRPAQNCAPHYGFGLNFCEVKNIEKDRYTQEIYKTVIPDWKPSILSTHTFNRIDKIAVSDALKRRNKFF